MVSARLEEQLDVLGVSNAFVFFKDREKLSAELDASLSLGLESKPRRPSLDLSPEDRASLEGYFISGADSQLGALSLEMDRPPPPAFLYFPYLGVGYGTVTAESAAALDKHDLVERVVDAPVLSLIRPVETGALAVAPPASTTWGIQRLRVPELWDQGLTGRGVTVAHLDTGADGRHPCLQGAIAKYAYIDMQGRVTLPPGPASDTGSHGTHTAATIAGRPVAGGPAVGVAPGATLLVASVIEFGDVVARVLGGLNWALAEGARVVSLSLGIRGWEGGWLPIFATMRAQELLPVVAVGNEGPQTSRSPGNYPLALSVGSVNEGGAVSAFSGSQTPAGQIGASPDLCAPGDWVLSAAVGGGFREDRGTSMATPHVAGLAALLMEARPDATIDQIERAIFASCYRPPAADPLRMGRGVPDAVRALALL